MAITPLTTEPSSFVAGDSVAWKRNISGFYAPEWTLHYTLRSDNQIINLTSVADGTDHLINISAATSITYKAGRYYWAAYVTNAIGERLTLTSGYLEIKPDPSTADIFDSRSHCKKTLDAIEATIEGRATADQLEYSIAGRTLKRTPIEQLLKFRDIYKAEYGREQAAERIARGLGGKKKILVRFKNA